MENRALGKGLSALIPEKATADGHESISYIKTALVKENTFQPRTDFDKARLEDLIASVKEQGVLQPILVRKYENGFEVIAGERRLRAARELDMEEVPAIIRDVSDQEALVLALVENIQREELNPIEEAFAFKRLIDDFHYTQDQIAQSVAKDRSTISNILRLLKLPLEIQKSVVDGELSFGHARALLGIDDATTLLVVYRETIKKGLSVRELENIIKQKAAGPRQKKSTSKTGQQDPYLVDIQEDMQRLLGTKVRIASQKKRGRIEIEFYSPSDLDRIYKFIKR